VGRAVADNVEVSVLFLTLWLHAQLVAEPPIDLLRTIDDVITAPHDFVVAAVGDIIARNANAALRATGDFDAPFVEVVSVLKDVDLVVGNVESPLFAGCKTLTYSMRFCGDERAAAALVRVGIDVVTTSNNHQLDHGVQGKADTTATLEAAGLLVTDDFRKPVFVDVKGTRVAFVGMNAIGTGPGWRRHWNAAIEAADAASDVVIVMPHWGREYAAFPKDNPKNGVLDSPRLLASQFQRAGADLIVGNHPHVLQGVEVVEDVVVMYSHGNFFFDQRGLPQRQTAIGLYAFSGGKVVDIAFIPFEQREMTLVRLVDAEKEAVLDVLRARSVFPQRTKLK
jgi:poly-gamma-glutamate capsule biosynthesis protein CapA/YwtB (metallophosphatase superfamily)